MMGREDDQRLVEACRAGRTEAFGMLVLRYKDRLYPTIARLTGSPEDALDILQDAFLRAYQKLGHFQGGSSFYTWVYRIAVNLALSERRKRRPAIHRPGPLALDPAEAADDPERSDPAGPLELADRKRLVEQALETLAPEYRAVVVLKDMDGLRYEEIAETLGIPIGTVRSRLHRGRCELRDRLGPLLHAEDAVYANGRERIDPRGPGTTRLDDSGHQPVELP